MGQRATAHSQELYGCLVQLYTHTISHPNQKQYSVPSAFSGTMPAAVQKLNAAAFAVQINILKKLILLDVQLPTLISVQQGVSTAAGLTQQTSQNVHFVLLIKSQRLDLNGLLLRKRAKQPMYELAQQQVAPKNQLWT